MSIFRCPKCGGTELIGLVVKEFTRSKGGFVEFRCHGKLPFEDKN